MYKPLLLLSLLLASPCSMISDNFCGNFPDEHYFLERFPDNKKSVIIFKFYSKDQIGELRLWCRVQDESFVEQSVTNCVKIKISNHNKIMMLDPGIYALSNYSEDKGGREYIKIPVKKIMIDKSRPVVFEVKSSEIIYIGALSQEGSYIKIDDEASLIKKILKKQDYEILQEGFDNNLQEIQWLVRKYNSSPKALVTRLVKIDYKSKKIFFENGQKYVSGIMQKNGQEGLKDLSKLIILMNEIIKLEQQKNTLNSPSNSL